jgi:DNA (cytosine-5)-methyltransferase 1
VRIGSLFTGYSGLDLGVFGVLPGARLVWHSDIKPEACRLMEFRTPGLPNLGDIKKIDPTTVEPVDVLTFGWPCQPFSAAGKRLGEADPRALWPEVARLIAGLRPRYLFGENVARIASNGELGRVVLTLAHLGYVGTYRTLRASDVGAPHRRDRLALFAVHADAAPDAGGLGLPGRTAEAARTTNEQREGPRPEVAGRGGDAGLTLLPTPAARLGMSGNVTPEVARERAARRGNGPNLDDAIALLPTPRPQTHAGGGFVDESWLRRRELNPNIGGPNLATAVVHEQRRTGEQWGQYAAAVARWERVLGRPAPEPTMTSTRGGQVLAPAFVEWMQGLPQGWVTDVPGLSRSQRLSLLGDGVVPQWAAAAFTELTGRFALLQRAG